MNNLRGVFEVTRDLSGLHIGIIDDVVTTGATATELTRVLLNAGCSDVQVVSIARTPRS